MNKSKNKSPLLRYTRNESNQKIGLVVAVERGKVGWSRCWMGNEDDPFTPPPDQWNQELALKIALGRALKGSRKRIPDVMLRTIVESYQAAERYF